MAGGSGWRGTVWRAYNIMYCLKVISYCTVSVKIFKPSIFTRLLLRNGTYMKNVVIPPNCCDDYKFCTMYDDDE